MMFGQYTLKVVHLVYSKVNTHSYNSLPVVTHSIADMSMNGYMSNFVYPKVGRGYPCYPLIPCVVSSKWLSNS